MIKEDFFKNKIGVIGAGNIGRSVILKLLEKGYPYDNIQLSYNGSIFTFSALFDDNLVDMISDNSRLVNDSSIILLSVPPQSFEKIGDFGLDKDTLVISFMAGISIDKIKKQTKSENVVRVIPTGPDTIKNSCAIAGTYPGNAAADFLFDLLDFDYYVVDSEDKMDYMVIAGCLPAVYCRVDSHSNESVRDIQRFAGDFDEFIEISKKAEKLVPTDNIDEFVKQVSTPGGVTEAIISSLDQGNSLYDSLLAGIKRNNELS